MHINIIIIENKTKQTKYRLLFFFKKPSFFFGSLNTSSNVKTGNYKKKKRKPVCTCHLAYGNLMTASSSNDLPTTGASYQYQHPPMNLYGSQPIIDPNNHGSSMIPSNCLSLIPQHHPHQQQQQQHHYSSSTTCLFPNSHHQFYDVSFFSWKKFIFSSLHCHKYSIKRCENEKLNFNRKIGFHFSFFSLYICAFKHVKIESINVKITGKKNEKLSRFLFVHSFFFIVIKFNFLEF